MRSSKLVKSLFILACFPVWAATPALFATKLSLDSLRFVSADGKYSYAQKRSGALTMISDFKSRDIVEAAPGTNYLVSSSNEREKVVIEVERNWHQELDLTKLHEIWVGDMGQPALTKVGMGRVARLHGKDQWMSYYDPKAQTIHLQYLPVTKRHYVIRLNRKHNPYFMPEVLMLDPETVMYTDVNDQGQSALLSYNIVSNKTVVMIKSSKTGSRFELCTYGRYAALGEFPYYGVRLGSSIRVMAWKAVPGTTGFAEVYASADNDVGQMVCTQDKIWFVKTTKEDFEVNNRITEAASITVPGSRLAIETSLERVSNLINMDGRILLPLREDTYVLSGDSGSKVDSLQSPKAKSP